MKYMGSKAKYSKEILPIILKNRKPYQWYVEPFVGGANTLSNVQGPSIGNDINCDLINMYKAMQLGWEPPKVITEEDYATIRKNSEKYPSELVAFVAIGCSYSGKWWGGYARGNDSKGHPRNYARESRDNLLKQKIGLQNTVFLCGSYEDLVLPKESIIYCDPPYANSTEYKYKFDTEKFWDWCRSKIKEGHTIFVSEYCAPHGWTEVWRKQVFNSLTRDTGSKVGIERLFTCSV